MSNAEKFLVEIKQPLEKYALAGNFDNFMKSAFIAISSNSDIDKLLATPKGKESVYNALRAAATNGLSLNPADGKAAIIGYNGKNGPVVNYQIMKNGLVELAMRTGNVEWVRTETVRENDELIFAANPSDELVFRPARKNRGEIDGFFAEMKLKNGSTLSKYMDLNEVEEHRKKYSSRSEMPTEGYGEKTVLKKLLNRSKVADFDLDDQDFIVKEEKGTSSDEALKKLEKSEKVLEITPEKIEDIPATENDESLI